MFPLDRLEDIKNHPNDFKLLERVPITRDDVVELLPIQLTPRAPEERVCAVVFLDTETTGMSALSDKVIELGMVRCTFSLDRKILLSIDRIYDAYEDPKRPIPEEITKLTGITDEMVRGQVFDDELVLNLVAGNPLIVAHNAKFDRPFFDRRFGQASRCAWACSAKEINWSNHGFGGYKLEFLVQSMGYFYEAHRACNDCLALCYLMHLMPKAFEELINSSLTQTFRIDAVKAPFDVKDQLKQNGYRFDGTEKVWYINVIGTEEAKNQVNLLQSIYSDATRNVRITSMTAKDRYRS